MADSKSFITRGEILKAIGESLPSGYEYITTKSGFNPSTVFGGTWTGPTVLTVVSSSSIASEGTFTTKGTSSSIVASTFISPTALSTGGRAIGYTSSTGPSSADYMQYNSGLKINSTTSTLYKWVKS